MTRNRPGEPGSAAPGANRHREDEPKRQAGSETLCRVATGSPTTRVSKTLWPGQPGTMRLMRQHGDDLVCVRYRHDASGQYRYTTIEVIVDHAPIGGSRFARRIFEVTVSHLDRSLREALLADGAKWDQGRQTWRVSGSAIRRLGLSSQVSRPLPK